MGASCLEDKDEGEGEGEEFWADLDGGKADTGVSNSHKPALVATPLT